jgi:DNA-binding transcriptional MerR regulator
VAQHVLRFWESKFPQVRPLKRGGGRRYYRPEDVELLRQIRALLYDEGYTIRGAQKLLRARRARPGGTPPPAGARAEAPPPAAEPGLNGAPPSRRLAAAAPAAAAPAQPAVDLRRELQQLRAELFEVREVLRRARTSPREG